MAQGLPDEIEAIFNATAWTDGIDMYSMDLFQERLEKLSGELAGQSSDSQEKLRRMYAFHCLPTKSAKALQSVISAERLGYSLDGFSGWFGILNVRAAKILTLALEVLQMIRVPVLALQVHLGQTGHALQTRRVLWSYYHHVYRLADDQRLGLRPRELRGEARREIVGLMCLPPQMGTDLRTPVDGCVTASDACETGLGVSRTVDLSEFGRSTVLTQTLGGDLATQAIEGGPFSCALKVVLISVFDGIGGLRRSLQRLQVQVVLKVCV